MMTRLPMFAPCAVTSALCAAIFGCAEAPPPPNTEWTLGPATFEVGGLADDPQYALGEVAGGIRLDDGRVVVADRLGHALRLYSPEGDFLKEEGGEGQGPGEFEYLREMGRCAEGLIVAFQMDWGENRYDQDLEFVGTRPALIEAVGGRAYELACNESGYVLATGWGDFRGKFQEGFYVATAPIALLHDGELVRDFGERLSSERVGTVRPDGSPAGSSPHPFGRSMAVALGPTRAYLGDAADYRIEVYDLQGDRLPDITWEGPDVTLPPEDFEALVERMVSRAAPSDQPAVRRRWEGLPPVDRYPAYDRIVTGVDGSVWVRHFPRVGAETAEWVVFGPDGVRLGSLALPLRATLLDASPDWVLVSELDELDVPTVRLYPIEG